jgi:two-component system, NarL family, sensor kinase
MGGQATATHDGDGSQVGRRREGGGWRPVLVFAASGAVALLLLGVGALFTLQEAARGEALADARRATSGSARATIEPALRDDVLDGAPEALARLDAAARKLSPEVRRAKLWSADGTIVWSDEPRLTGTRYELDDHDRAVLDHGGTESEISDLGERENRFERDEGELLEVYTRVRTPDGTPLLYEEYLRSESVTDSSRRVALRFLPIVLGALLLLELVQVPLAISLVRRLEQRRHEREGLLRQVVEASDLERRRVARDLHDGVVQQVAGASMGLHAAAAAARAAGNTAEGDAMGSAAAELRSAVRGLRTLVVEIYPPNLAEVGLGAALEDQLSAAPAGGPVPHLQVQDAEQLDERTQALLFRVAQEAIRNALRHSGASDLWVRVAHVDAAEGAMATLEVRDNGQGFDTAGPPPEGHVGLRIVRELVETVGGTLQVMSGADGTTVRAEVPFHAG